MSEEIEKFKRRAERERRAREEAEALLENKSRDLFDANEALRKMASSLEAQVAERTSQLESAVRQAQASEQAKGEFLAMMSHEIRTPLNAILGMAELMDTTELSEVQATQLATLRRSGDDLLVLINDILDLSKFEAGKLELEQRIFDPIDELSSVIDLYAPVAQAKGLTLRIDPKPGLPPWLIGDSTRLRQILSNLLSNALKFTETGGVVVTISASVESPLCVLRGEVTDTGIGIRPDRIEKLFKVFSQVDSSTTRRFGGTGLGLAICVRLCEAMSGDIEVDSEPGRGSSFRFTVRMLPAERKETQDVKPVVPIEGNLERLRVLVVEDVSANRFVIRSQLLRLGVACEEAHDGAQALDRVRRADDFSLILMDVQMPIMDGLDATRNIRLLEADRGLARTPVIGLTAGVLTSELEKCIDAGMNEVLSKPISLRSLRTALLRYLPLEQS